jgi:hypothetical protein
MCWGLENYNLGSYKIHNDHGSAIPYFEGEICGHKHVKVE